MAIQVFLKYFFSETIVDFEFLMAIPIYYFDTIGVKQ
jgi:hypothetical protein